MSAMAAPVPDLPTPETWALWRVTVEQTRGGEALIYAPSLEQAQKDAEELADDIIEGDLSHTDVSVYHKPLDLAAKRGPWEMVWTGGPDGEWVPADRFEPDPEQARNADEIERRRPRRGQLDFLGNEVS